MKIAIYGDSLADPQHYLYSYKVNSKLSRDSHLRTWAERLKQDGYTVDFYTGMSRHPLWVDEHYQATKDQYDKKIIRCYNWNKPNFTWKDYDKIVKEDFKDLYPNTSHLFSKLIDQSKDTVRAVQSWALNLQNPAHDARVFSLLIDSWLSDKDTLFITPALTDNKRWGIPSITPWTLPQLNLVQERKLWLEEIGCTTDQFNKVDTILQGKLWHKHINHIPIESHRSTYEHIANWIETGKHDQPIKIQSWDYYSVDCDVCKEFEKEMKCQQEG